MKRTLYKLWLLARLGAAIKLLALIAWVLPDDHFPKTWHWLAQMPDEIDSIGIGKNTPAQ